MCCTSCAAVLLRYCVAAPPLLLVLLLSCPPRCWRSSSCCCEYRCCIRAAAVKCDLLRNPPASPCDLFSPSSSCSSLRSSSSPSATSSFAFHRRSRALRPGTVHPHHRVPSQSPSARCSFYGGGGGTCRPGSVGNGQGDRAGRGLPVTSARSLDRGTGRAGGPLRHFVDGAAWEGCLTGQGKKIALKPRCTRRSPRRLLSGARAMERDMPGRAGTLLVDGQIWAGCSVGYSGKDCAKPRAGY